ncbi:uncharacterized protein N7479_004356 [Penicillium vulpinum]|uniref:YCII-related domain-containing protein n=1 Tax=Penicillium vulpinum TaxID=29845 RepID=A0A1V6SCM4_9EURO|nr:uncharacterized protein N7479_004356 [Penicillium vulpinum]KAJ5964480.1 hypothetical protein N7479_004356 [Penicillium vulpinum]OQE11658.1 hypothetical protein PENVUL_c002G03432 [Penicillium vulpinum]
MSTGKHDFLVQVPIDPSTLQVWASNRNAHMAHLKPYILDGTIVFGGPTIAAHPKSSEDTTEVRSSVLLFQANSEEEVRGIIEKNPFVDAGVWDMEKVVIAPFMCGVRTAM